MPRRLVNLLLLSCTVALIASGIIPWLLPEAVALPLYTVHRIAGVALLLALVWKYGIARTSLRRRLRSSGPDRALLAAIAASGILVFALASGVAWTTGFVSFDRPIPYSTLNLHVFAGALLLPLVVVHGLQRWERRPAARRLVTRRAALRLLALGGATALTAAALDLFDPLRRISGSRHAGSFNGNEFPLTIWRFDSVPTLDAATWRLVVSGLVAAPRALRLVDLEVLPSREVDAVIDCTGGWWSEQRWRGVALRDVIAASAPLSTASRATITSVTGHAWSFGLDELGELMLATHVGGDVLSSGHGYPLRLVAPGRRGFQWIKWVALIEVS